MIPLSTLRARLAKLEAARLPPRQVLVVAASPDRVDWQQIAELEGEGAQVVIVTTGVCRNPDGPDEAEAGMVVREVEARP